MCYAIDIIDNNVKETMIEQTIESAKNQKEGTGIQEEEKLTKIFFEFGEEKFSKKIARNIVKFRKIKIIDTTSELSELIKNRFLALNDFILGRSLWILSKSRFNLNSERSDSPSNTIVVVEFFFAVCI